MPEKKTIVISAVNLRKGGTLTILRDCLQYLSDLIREGDYRVVALVHKRELCDYEGIEYIEMPDIIKGWGKRLWCEYVTMHKISKELAPVYLWLSLHDTSPRVKADRQAVYCQTSFPFYNWSLRDFKMDFKIPLFSMFTKYAYKVNIKSNRYLVVQQNWLREGFSKMFGLDERRFIVAPPQKKMVEVVPEEIKNELFTFFYASTPDCHKNFETLCEAARLLENEMGPERFKVVLTLSGDENRYSRWLNEGWGNVRSIEFAGFMSKGRLYGHYKSADCFVFPSKVETWGLPITEFMEASGDKPMLLPDLPYAHETAAGASQVCFFNPSDPRALKERMKELIQDKCVALASVPKLEIEEPKAESWTELFEILLS
ncbi:MAG: glycosyltransferase family 4 protein [Bacteroidales bacterium]|nr:glycosyltransferase family 4 protein [Bacteroidaceae bacterium]MBO5106861.1 glycosyltransferase family 4 protein [Bacteroidales bacterium]